MIRTALLLPIILLSFSCQSSSTPEADCNGAKCDTPGDTANRECREMCGDDSSCFDDCREDKSLAFCEARRDDALASAQRAFTSTAIRWSCADVEGVNTVGGDDRGQEYCEYMAIVQPPPLEEGKEPPSSQAFGRRSQDLGFELTEDQMFQLEDEPDAIVGQCLFTSWHQDIRIELPVCEGSGCPSLEIPSSAKLPSWSSARALGYPLTTIKCANGDWDQFKRRRRRPHRALRDRYRPSHRRG